MSETLEPQEAAYIGAKAGYELFGEPLRPYSPSRKVAAQSMGMLYPFIGEEGAAQMEQTGMYPGVVKDAAIVLWLCSRKDALDLTPEDVREGAWTPARALDKPRDALAAAIKWAEGLEILDIGSPRFVEALGIFMAVATAVEASRFEVVDPDARNDEDSPKV